MKSASGKLYANVKRSSYLFRSAGLFNMTVKGACADREILDSR